MPKSSKSYAEMTPAERTAKSRQTHESRKRTRERALALRHQMLKDSNTSDVFLTREEVAALKAISVDTLSREIKAGRFPQGMRIGKRRLVWKRSTVFNEAF